jgi:hypothetical protein
LKAIGIGAVSGLTYQETVVANSSFKTSLVNDQATRTFVGRITVVAPGRQQSVGPDLHAHNDGRERARDVDQHDHATIDCG